MINNLHPNEMEILQDDFQNLPDNLKNNNYSALLFSFVKKCKFNLINLNEVNINGVTPLTAAIENVQEEITIELLSINVNPLIENIHGNTPIGLSLLNPWFSNIIAQAISIRTCSLLNCVVGESISYLNNNYKIIKIIRRGSCSLVTMEILDLKSSEIFFAKIKPYFGGLELRNYISLNQYIDLFQIEKLIINDSTGDSKIYKKVYCLVQKYISGKILSETFNDLHTNSEKMLVARSAIKALCDLHQQGYIHNDSLPDNCLWDPINKIAQFVDYDVMSKFTDFTEHEQDPDLLMEKKLLDLERLIIGETSSLNEQSILGLKDYVDNIEEILSEIEDLSISDDFKNKLLKRITSKNIFDDQRSNSLSSMKINCNS